MKNEQAPTNGNIILFALGIAGLYLLLVVILDAIIEVEEPVETPEITIEFLPYGENDTAILITNVTPTAVPINDTSLYIKTKIDNTSVTLVGSLRDETGLDFGNETVNITFLDNDGDGNVSINDTLLLRSEENGGWFDPLGGTRIYLIYDPSGEEMNPKPEM